MSYLNILRTPNLIIVALTIWAFAKYAYYPELVTNDIRPVMSMKDLYLLIFITACLAAGGYLLNDLVDTDSDHINDKRSYIKSGLEKKIGYLMYIVITLAPIPFAFSLASEIKHPEYISLYFLMVMLLIAYNYVFKNLLIFGNLIISLLCASVVGVLLFGEWESLNGLKKVNKESYQYIVWISSFYIGFGLMSNLNREIIKDVEDIKGDTEMGSKTLPIVIGVKHTKLILLVLQVTSISLLVFWILSGPVSTTLYYIKSLALLIMPAIFLVYKIYQSNKKEDFHVLSSLYKAWMIVGLLFIISVTI